MVDSAETPGGCWAHFSHIATDAAAGYRTAHAGQQVVLEWEPAHQDGFAYRAVQLWPVGETPTTAESADNSSAYTSTLTLTFDDPKPDVDH